ncbi:MAG: 50S ribosomal protein L29 [Burkholderiales bacterium]
MNTAEMRSKSPAELKQELMELLKAQFSLRMQHATQQLSDSSQLGKVRLDIARVRTVLNEKAKQA